MSNNDLQPLDDITKQRIRALFQEGLKPDEIAQQLDVDENLITEFLISEDLLVIQINPGGLSNATVEELIQQYTAPTINSTVLKLCSDFDISPNTLYKILDQKKIPRKEISKSAKDERDEKIKNLYLKNHTYHEIEIQTGVSQSTIIRTIRKLNLPMRQPREI